MTIVDWQKGGTPFADVLDGNNARIYKVLWINTKTGELERINPNDPNLTVKETRPLPITINYKEKLWHLSVVSKPRESP